MPTREATDPSDTATPQPHGTASPTPTRHRRPAGATTVVPAAAAVHSTPPYITITSDHSVVSPGQIFHFTIRVLNRGTNAATAVHVADTLPPTLTIISATASEGRITVDGQRVALRLDRLDAGATISIVLTVRVNENVAGGTISDTVQLSGIMGGHACNRHNTARCIAQASVRVIGLPNTGDFLLPDIPMSVPSDVPMAAAILAISVVLVTTRRSRRRRR